MVVSLDKEDKVIQSIIEEYKMSMGGSFFNKVAEEDPNMKLERLMVESTIENHLFDIHELLSIYDKLSEFNKRMFFQKVVLKFVELYSNTDK